jgi:DNA-binding transcriptional regulator YdaS (Cro superfamily)
VKLELKIELIRRFGSQIVAARHLGIGESRLSHLVRGHAEPSEKERAALERALGPSVAKKVLKRSAPPAEQPAELAEGA